MSAHKPNPLLTIGFTPDALNDDALQTVMIALIDTTFMVVADEVTVIGQIKGASNTELHISSGMVTHFIPWDEIAVLEYQ